MANSKTAAPLLPQNDDLIAVPPASAALDALAWDPVVLHEHRLAVRVLAGAEVVAPLHRAKHGAAVADAAERTECKQALVLQSDTFTIDLVDVVDVSENWLAHHVLTENVVVDVLHQSLF